MGTTKPSGPDRELMVALIGLLTTIVVSVVVAMVEVYFGVALYSLSVFFVIPAGALGVGMAAASGYYLGAVLFNQKPVGGVLINMLVAAACAFWLIHYIPYWFLEVDGRRVADYIPFWEYMDILIRSTTLTFSVHQRDIGTTGELGGSWGYAYTVLQFLAFILGGLAVFFWLKEKPFCNACSKYLKTTRTTHRTGDGDALLGKMQTFAGLLGSRAMPGRTSPPRAVDRYAESREAAAPLRGSHGVRVPIVSREPHRLRREEVRRPRVA